MTHGPIGTPVFDSTSCVAFDDPVPSDSGIFRELSPSTFKAHSVESQVQRKLLAHPKLQFSSLVVRRMPNNGVCLEGVLESTDGSDLGKLARQVDGVQQVLNRLVVRGADLQF